MSSQTRLSIILILLSLILSPIWGTHSSFNRYSRRRHRLPRLPHHLESQRRQTITHIQLQQLDSYLEAYDLWIKDLLDQQPAGSLFAVQLRQRHQLFQSWVEDWIQAVGSGEISSTAPEETIPPIRGNQPSSSQLSYIAPQNDGGQSSVIEPNLVATVTSQLTVFTTNTHISQRPSIVPSSGVLFLPIEGSSADSAPSSAAKISPGTSPSKSPMQGPPGSPNGSQGQGSSSNSFNPEARDNVVVYWGQAGTTSVDLKDMCEDPGIDVVILAFLTQYKADGGYPSVDFSNACFDHTPRQNAAGAIRLLHCPEMTRAIRKCQQNRKIVLLSIGGAVSKVDFNAEKDAIDAAAMLWDLFGSGNGQDPGMRPFGDAILDGFDIDTESKNPLHYIKFVEELREKMTSDTSKKYYLTAAPQCINPDESIPFEILYRLDLVWVQFYNNPSCGLQGPGFQNSFTTWAHNLSDVKVFAGIPACDICAGSGYLPAADLQGKIAPVKDLPNFGGIMMWDGSRAKSNANFAAKVKQILIG